ncbi:MAG: PEP-CTERM sorting domain-containing protein [Phycisphaerales bacterium]|nr:PEP-CTERM sorting domain-containing protein [Phycisphaerales bacterium]MCB9854290.1 PEP-CTERM sorting domain-containing protein [Phycisphaerales bacterium]MCB9863491.1 PEP-CTERM sorting domain-containing protein [Phycisphaerales bacterium]
MKQVGGFMKERPARGTLKKEEERKKVKRYLSGLIVAFIASLAAAAPASAAIINGSANGFAFSLDNATAWGSPTVIAAQNVLLFNAAQFNVDSTGTTTAGDTVSIMVNPNPGLSIGEIFVTAAGSYDLNGAGTSVDFDLSFTIQDLNGPSNIVQPVAASEPFPLVAGVNAGEQQAGQFSAVNNLDISALLGYEDEVQIDLTEFSQALGNGIGGTSSLNVQLSALQLKFVFIPEPGTLSLLILSSGLVLVRRRR